MVLIRALAYIGDAQNNSITKMTSDPFSLLFSPHIPMLYRMAYQWTLNDADAEDLVQELASKMISKVDQLKSIEQLRPWLVKVMYRLFVDRYRRKKNSPVVFENSLDDQQTINDSLITDNHDPENKLHASNLKATLIAELKKIEPNRAAALFLFEVEGYSITEIADIQGISEGTVKSRIFRAKTNLKKTISLGTFWDVRS